MVSTISQYYGVLLRLDDVQNAQRNYDTLNKVYERVEKLANAGRVPKLELDRIGQDMFQARDTLIQAEKEYKQALDEFKITLSVHPTTEFQLDLSELEVLRDTEIIYPDFSETEAVETALLQRLDLANSTDAIFDSQRKVFVAVDSLRAQLDLGVNANIPLQDLSSSNAKALQDFLLSGLNVDLPFDRDFEKNIYRKALITLNQRQREYDEAADMVMLQVRRAYRDLTEAAERHRVQLESLKLAEKRFKKTYLLLQYSRASSRRVLSAQNDLFDAQNAATRALVDYTIATLKFYRDTEVLQVRPDGMWEL
jgi:outer membrane protein TolC